MVELILVMLLLLMALQLAFNVSPRLDNRVVGVLFIVLLMFMLLSGRVGGRRVFSGVETVPTLHGGA